jgi:streptomycin 6-kinase
VRTARQAVTHGDLHGDNLFVEKERAWIIDFERTGPGHALRDFAELEVDIFTRLANPQQLDWPTLLELALALVRPATPTAAIMPTALINATPAALKALNVIKEVRSLAQEVVHHTDQREYLWSMLFDALFIASIGSAAPDQQLRAMLLSALICERLSSWGEQWPPVDWGIT